MIVGMERRDSWHFEEINVRFDDAQ